MQKRLLATAGTACVGVGIAGIFIPILPTTPFLLLAAYCYMRSSNRLYRWLLNNRFFGSYVKNYVEGRGMPLHLKIITIALLWITIGLTTAFGVENIAIRIVLIIIAAAVTTHIVMIKAKVGSRKKPRC
ncbi:MAG: YbaN family protein [Dehalococcoidales bacterium]|nr:YbaN family protein [Dehalococcoidales bacterium]